MAEDQDNELHEFIFPQEDGTNKSMHLSIETFSDIFKEWHEARNPRKPIEEVEFVWCLVGNIIKNHYYGVEKKIVSGSKHFRANTKVYCLLPPWNHFSTNILTIGLTRKGRRFISVITPNGFVTNYRIQKVYNRKLIELIYRNNGWRDTDQDKETILQILEWIPEKTIKFESDNNT